MVCSVPTVAVAMHAEAIVASSTLCLPAWFPKRAGNYIQPDRSADRHVYIKAIYSRTAFKSKKALDFFGS